MELGKEPLPGISSFRTVQTAGHKVSTPVLTGLGEDSHRLSPAVNLDSHIDDVADISKRENLHGATLVGHSYDQKEIASHRGQTQMGISSGGPDEIPSLVEPL
jgi:arginase family enzyme